MGIHYLSDGNKCPICGELNCSIWANGVNDPFYYYECPKCGAFFVPNPNKAFYTYGRIESRFNLNHLQSYLFYHKSHLRPVICEKEYFNEYITDDLVEIYNITPEMVESWYPKNFAEKIDLILLKLGEVSTYDGDYIKVYDLADKLFFLSTNKSKNITKGADNIVQIQYIINYLEKEDYLFNVVSNAFQLTHKALERIYELQKNQTNNKNVFVAMQFGEGTKELREKIKEGLTGFNVRIMDEIEHNHQIVPEMLYEIRNSRFVIAELSHHNNGAYYEAGYALGLGKEVIHICDKKELKNRLHFDVAQVNTITYDSIDEIPEKLRKRIDATIVN